MSNNKQSGVIIILFLLFTACNKPTKQKITELRVTDSIIYYNGEKLINESP